MSSRPSMATSTSESFKATELSLSIQKKVFGRMASNKNVVKHLIDDTSGNLLDNLHRLNKTFIAEAKAKGIATSKDMEKVVKHLIKIIIKIAVLFLNDQFSETESALAAKIQRSLRSTLMAVVSFHEVDYSYDRTFLVDSFESLRNKLKGLIKPHLSEKSAGRVDIVFNFFTNEHFLDRFFEAQRSNVNSLNDPIYKIRCQLIADINTLLERGRL